MNRALIFGVFGLLGVLGYLFFAKSTGASEVPSGGGDTGGGSGDSSSDQPQHSGVHPEFDSMILTAANANGVDPVILKAIVAKESSFNPNAINPEGNYSLMGTPYAQYDAAGQSALVAWIKAGNDPSTIALNPSIGIAQVRLSTARALGFSVNAQTLFNPQTCLTISAALLAQLFSAGITLDTIDAYNVGQALKIRNLPYRDAVNQFAAQFAGDFS